jgi:regulator of extracellular matrix RemA (YlzA/DUF370 family)
MKVLHVGFKNYINAEEINAIIDTKSTPVTRDIQNATDKGTAIYATKGRKTRTAIYMKNGSIVLSALQSGTLAGRQDE